MAHTPISRRTALKVAAASLAAPAVFRAHAKAAPNDTLLHVSVGGGGMARADINSLSSHKNLKLVAFAEVDTKRAAELLKNFPDAKHYTDWREMFDKEKFDSVNVSTPDHTHASPTMRAIRAGKHVYTQKPLTQTLHEARQLTLAAKEHKIVSQMGIQIHSAREHRTVVATIRAGLIGKVKEVHSWSGKSWGDNSPRPDVNDPVPESFKWDLWLGPVAERPFIAGGYYHPGNWRKRLDFGTGTFGDMGCHILDPVFESMDLKTVLGVRSEGEAPNDHNWALHCKAVYTFQGTEHTTDTVKITWYNGNLRPDESVAGKLGDIKLPGQGSIYIGTDGILYSPYIGMPVLLPAEKFQEVKLPVEQGKNHYHEFVDACLGNAKTSAPFEYSGPLTEMVLLGCLSTRFPKETLEWDSANLKFTNNQKANQFVRREPRKGWEEPGL